MGGVSGTTGAGGAIAITSGASAGAGGTAGAVGIDTGAATGGTGAAITIGGTNATSVIVGRSGQAVTISGDPTVTQLVGIDSSLGITGKAGATSNGGAVPITGGAGDANNNGGATSLVGQNARKQLLVTGIYSSGQKHDFTHDVTYAVDAANVLRVEKDGLVIPLADGSATITATEASGKTATIALTRTRKA